MGCREKARELLKQQCLVSTIIQMLTFPSFLLSRLRRIHTKPLGVTRAVSYGKIILLVIVRWAIDSVYDRSSQKVRLKASRAMLLILFANSHRKDSEIMKTYKKGC